MFPYNCCVLVYHFLECVCMRLWTVLVFFGGSLRVRVCKPRRDLGQKDPEIKPFYCPPPPFPTFPRQPSMPLPSKTPCGFRRHTLHACDHASGAGGFVR